VAPPTLIYCADGNRRFAQTAIDAGFMYGSRLPAKSLHFPIWFADQDWKHPDRRLYMQCLSEHNPHMATVLDWEREEQLEEVIEWATEAAQYVEVIVIVPKVHHKVSLLPTSIAGKEVRLGYSVPTSYGGTELMVNEFFGWPVHLLGGSPQHQMELARYLDVRSADGNMCTKMAMRFGAFFTDKRLPCKNYPWPTLKEADGKEWGNDVPYEAFRRSCVNIMAAWRKM
jgi:hypothetical protein